MKVRSLTSVPRRWVIVAVAAIAVALFAVALGLREARSFGFTQTGLSRRAW